jgi:hypothetical protein
VRVSFRTANAKDGRDVARNPWRARARMAGVVLVGIAAGIAVGAVLVNLLINN